MPDDATPRPRPRPRPDSADPGPDQPTRPRQGSRPQRAPSGRGNRAASGRYAPLPSSSDDEQTVPRRGSRGTGGNAGSARPLTETGSVKPVRARPADRANVRVSASATTGPTVGGFERYQFGDELGRGGLGVVRIAEDTALRREVAIKTLLRPEGSSLAAFIEEAQITGQLEHPNIVPLHELGYDPAGRPYI
ncbi:MAG: protein kinase, partial [Planctomycetota bacterium]